MVGGRGVVTSERERFRFEDEGGWNSKSNDGPEEFSVRVPYVASHNFSIRIVSSGRRSIS